MNKNHRQSKHIAEIKKEFLSLPHGAKGEFIRIHAESLGISRAEFYREMGLKAKKSPKRPKINRRDEIVAKVARLKYAGANLGKTDRSNSFLRTEFCLIKLVQAGEIKGEVVRKETGLVLTDCEISVSTVDTCLRKIGFYEERRTYRRHEDPYVNHTHLVDFSPSKYFGKPVKLESGDWAIQVNRTGFQVYDGKPGDALERYRLWLVSFKDSKSRRQKSVYVVTSGENVMAMKEAMTRVYQSQEDVFHLPDNMKMDLGPVTKSETFINGLNLLGINLIESKSKSDRSRKEQGQGKIERTFRTQWQWEQENVFDFVGSGIKTILLSDLNTLIEQRCSELAHRDHPMIPGTRIVDYYATQIVQREQRICMTDLNDIFFRDTTRRADPSGIIRFDGQLWTVPDDYAKLRIKVYIAQGCLVGRAIDEDGVLGATEFDILPYDIDSQRGNRNGQPTFRERIMADDSLKVTPVSSVGIRREETAGNILTLKPATESVNPETPFTRSVDRPYQTVEQAKRELVQRLGFDRYSEVPAAIREILDLVAETHPEKLTPGYITSLASVINQ